jgi:hyperosmotically inducible periplasmic protein
MNKQRNLKTERIPLIVLGVFLALAGASCERRGLTDSAVTAAVKSKLASSDESDSADVNVDTSGGVVTLSGVVKTQSDKEQAERIAGNTEGVTRVINNITVAANGEYEAVEGATTASDLTILSKIKTRYVAEGVIGANVRARDGVVTLSGVVEDSQTRVRAESIARATSGVRKVNNQLKVRQ